MPYLVNFNDDGVQETRWSVVEVPETLEAGVYEVPDELESAEWLKLDGTTVVAMTDAEVETMMQDLMNVSTAFDNRLRRDMLLAETDWYVTKATETDTAVPANVTAYRTALRNLPDHANWPMLEEADWPTL